MHTCPGCGKPPGVPSHLFAHRPCWYRLPANLRAAIWQSYRDQPLGDAHRAAMTAARKWYRNNPA